MSMELPQAMANIWWDWPTRDPVKGPVYIEFDVKEEPGLWHPNRGVFIMALHGKIGGHSFYAGLQTNMFRPGQGPVGKGAIFSRWGSRDLTKAKWDEENGFAESAGHEGDFIGVRRNHDWGPGQYRLYISHWYGGWYEAFVVSPDKEKWRIGVLRFPRGSLIEQSVFSTVEVYGSGSQELGEMPTTRVHFSPPFVGGQEATKITTSYQEKSENSDVRFHFRRSLAERSLAEVEVVLGNRVFRIHSGQAIDINRTSSEYQRLVTVNAVPILVPEKATGADVKSVADSYGIKRTVRGNGGIVELRGYESAGGAVLVKDDKVVSKYDGFSYQEIEASNCLWNGRSFYWPPSPGKLNHHQIRAAVLKAHPGNSRIWKMHLVLAAPPSFMMEWTTDETSSIIENAPGVQYDNWKTLSEEQGKKLIQLMISHADARRARWAARRKPKKPKPIYQQSSGSEDKRSVRLHLLKRNGKFQRVDISKTLTPYGLAKLVVIHPQKIRVFWYEGMEKDFYEVVGVKIPLEKKRGHHRYLEGTASAEDCERLGISIGVSNG